MTYALVNFNQYLGGGETLLIRWAEYLQKNGYDFRAFYVAGSYIDRDLQRTGIPQKKLCPIESEVDYYYLNKNKRNRLRDEITSKIEDLDDVCFVSFDARELYTLFDITKNNKKYKLAHLVLHDQDNLYVCQTLWDKFVGRFLKKRNFSNKKMIKFNADIFNEVASQSIVIPQSDIEAELWESEFNIHLDKSKIVPLPVCDFEAQNLEKKDYNNKIIWVGRLVDFKLPALCAMIDYVGNETKYTLTIVGDGDMDFVRTYIKEHGYDLPKFTFMGKVNYEDLPSVICSHSIGYAMGTSIAEIGRYGIPVIMALGAPEYKMFDAPICGGVYIGVSKGNVGETLYYKDSNDKIESIEKAVKDIEGDYKNISQSCYSCLKENFDAETNFNKYTTYANFSNPVKSTLEIPQASFFRSMFFYMSKKKINPKKFFSCISK